MKIRYQAPTEAFPFFTKVRVQVRDGEGWRRVYEINDRIGGKPDALFHTKEAMVQKVKQLVRAGA